MKQSGFSLLEVVIYLGLFSLIMTSALVTVYILFGSVAQNHTFEAAYTEGIFINQKIAWAVADATDVVGVGSDGLYIVQPATTTFDSRTVLASSGRLWLQLGEKTPQPLSGPEFRMTDISFLVTATSPKKLVVRYKINDVPFSIKRMLPLNNTTKGFIALTAAIIVSLLLLLITATLAQSGWNLRYSVLGNEMRVQSYQVAEGCAKHALLLRLQDSDYIGNTTTTMSDGSCYVYPIQINLRSNEIVLRVTGSVSNSYTTLEYVFTMRDIYLGNVPKSSINVATLPTLLPKQLSRKEI